jgi:hypothetical protein
MSTCGLPLGVVAAANESIGFGQITHLGFVSQKKERTDAGED